jgi:hypothetical protein
MTGSQAKSVINTFLKKCQFVGFARLYDPERLVIYENENSSMVTDEFVLPFFGTDTEASLRDSFSYFVRPNMEYSPDIQYSKYAAMQYDAPEVELDEAMKKPSKPRK